MPQMSERQYQEKMRELEQEQQEISDAAARGEISKREAMGAILSIMDEMDQVQEANPTYSPPATDTGVPMSSLGMEEGTSTYDAGAFQELGTAGTGTFSNLGYKSSKAEDGTFNMTDRAAIGMDTFSRALGDQSSVISATQEARGRRSGAKTHTVGEAFDARSRDLTNAQLSNLANAALYSDPAKIGLDAARMDPHLHVDYNAGYGAGLKTRASTFNRLDPRTQSKLAAFNMTRTGASKPMNYPGTKTPVPLTGPNWDYSTGFFRTQALPDHLVPTPQRSPRSAPAKGPTAAQLRGQLSRYQRGTVTTPEARNAANYAQMEQNRGFNYGGIKSPVDIARQQGEAMRAGERQQAAARAAQLRDAYTDYHARAPNVEAIREAGLRAQANRQFGTPQAGLSSPAMPSQQRTPTPYAGAPANTPGNMGAAGYGLSVPSRTAPPQSVGGLTTNMAGVRQVGAQSPDFNRQAIERSRAGMLEQAQTSDANRQFGTPQPGLSAPSPGQRLAEAARPAAPAPAPSVATVAALMGDDERGSQRATVAGVNPQARSTVVNAPVPTAAPRSTYTPPVPTQAPRSYTPPVPTRAPAYQPAARAAVAAPITRTAAAVAPVQQQRQPVVTNLTPQDVAKPAPQPVVSAAKPGTIYGVRDPRTGQFTRSSGGSGPSNFGGVTGGFGSSYGSSGNFNSGYTSPSSGFTYDR